MTAREGQTLKSKYRLDQLLGSGGMGEVYRARNVLVDRTVAIKVLREELAANAQVVERFMREAKAANVVQHRHIVDVHDIDKTDDGVMFIVQEYLEGEDLATRLQALAGRGVPPAEALDVLIPVVEAVGAAHAHGVVHRDLKPDNVFLSVDGDDVVPKVLDFGISKLPVRDDLRRTAPGTGGLPGGARLTAVGTAMGTPLYMSPEQIRDPASVDARGDVWSLGVMLYETLSGRVPFDADDLAGLFAEICSREPTPLERMAPQVPAELARVVHRCLRAEREERYADATTLAERLRRCRLRLSEQLAAERGVAPEVPTLLSAPPPAMRERGFVHDATLPHRRDGDGAGGAPERSRPAAATEDFGLELDLPAPSSPEATSPTAGAGPSPPSSPESGARPESGSRRQRAAPADVGAVFGLFEDDDVPDLKLELDDDLPSPAARGRRPDRRTGRSSAAGRVRLTGRSAAPSPSPVDEMVRATVGALLCAGLAALAPYGSPAGLGTVRHAFGVDAYLPFVGVGGVLLLVFVLLIVRAARSGAVALLLAAVASLALAASSGVVALVLAAPGFVGGTLRMIALFVLPWSAIALAGGLTVFALGRAVQLLRAQGARLVGSFFAVAAVVGAVAAVWMVRQPLPTVATVDELQLVPVEARVREQVERLSVALAGARALRPVSPPLPAPPPRNGAAAAAALHPAASPSSAP